MFDESIFVSLLDCILPDSLVTKVLQKIKSAKMAAMKSMGSKDASTKFGIETSSGERPDHFSK